jgi:type II secretory pathway predicted ATPase ExeA
MYKAFYGLTRNPFEISPDPYFLFSTARHNEALASIVHGVLRHKGFIVVTGEVGTGKTLLVRCLLELLRRQGIASANVFNPCLSPLEFLRYIVGDLGIKTANQDKGSLLLELNNYLIARHRNNTTTVLIVDEAQHLEPELLEEIRLLTNLETSQQKLLQIVLVGQPELDQKMDSAALRQLKQRIALRCQLEPLQEEETRSYILRRLQRAGANSHATTMFPGETIASVYRYSKGIPRLINTVCENALIASYAGKAQSVRPEVIDEVAKDLRLNVLSRPAMIPPAVTVGQRDIAKSLLQFVEALERVARNSPVQEPSSDQGVEIV